MKKLLFTFFVVALMFIASAVSAHQPRLTFEGVATEGNPVVITNPTISQAFYGEMKGQPDYYRITLKNPTEMYFNLLLPNISEAPKNISADIRPVGQDEKYSIKLIGDNFSWSALYEEYAGDDYLKGPELKQKFSPGTYLIKIFNQDNQGKYVLVVGTEETWSPREMLLTLWRLPTLKTEFFAKGSFAIFEGTIGRYLGYTLLGIIVILLLVMIMIRRTKNFHFESKHKTWFAGVIILALFASMFNPLMSSALLVVFLASMIIYLLSQ